MFSDGVLYPSDVLLYKTSIDVWELFIAMSFIKIDNAPLFHITNQGITSDNLRENQTNYLPTK